MATTSHKDHLYSITVHTDDLAILYCLRALADFSQKTGNTRIAWSGTTKGDWKRNGNSVKFYFSEPKYRDGFQEVANRVLPKKSWDKRSQNDNDPAKPKK